MAVMLLAHVVKTTVAVDAGKPCQDVLFHDAHGFALVF